MAKLSGAAAALKAAECKVTAGKNAEVMLDELPGILTTLPLPAADQPDSSRSTARLKPPAGAEAFDILPTQGTLGAGQSQCIECAYYALPGQRAAALAVCQVEGGPSYRLPLSAESNAMK